eukprot:s907_g10.t1
MSTAEQLRTAPYSSKLSKSPGEALRSVSLDRDGFRGPFQVTSRKPRSCGGQLPDPAPKGSEHSWETLLKLLCALQGLWMRLAFGASPTMFSIPHNDQMSLRNPSRKPCKARSK